MEMTDSIPRSDFFRRCFGRWVALSQYGFPFSIGRDMGAVSRFRRLARHWRFAQRPLITRSLIHVVMTFVWPIGAFLTAQRIWRKLRARGIGHGLAYLADMYWLALRHNIPPVEYALYRLDCADRRRDIHEYVYWIDLPGIAALTAGAGADSRDVQDKDRFAAICAQHGLPHVPTLAVFEGGKQKFPPVPFIPDASVLWVKSLRRKAGAGSAKWTKRNDGYCNAAGRLLLAKDLVEEFHRRDCIVQPFLENHSDVAPLTNGALAAARIVTGLDAQGEAQFVTTLLGLPFGKHQTSVAAIVCSVADDGCIQTALLPDGEPISSHPDTAVSLVGVVVPYWRESIALARRAHAVAFNRFPFLGWDVAVTREGPILLETNAGWGAIFHQMLEGPLGHTEFSRLVSRHV